MTKLDLSDNWLGPQGANYVSRMLKENCFISDLNLSENHLSTQGCETLREILKNNISLTHLTFQGNNFDDTTAEIWADIISVINIHSYIFCWKFFLYYKNYLEYNAN